MYVGGYLLLYLIFITSLHDQALNQSSTRDKDVCLMTRRNCLVEVLTAAGLFFLVAPPSRATYTHLHGRCQNDHVSHHNHFLPPLFPSYHIISYTSVRVLPRITRTP